LAISKGLVELMNGHIGIHSSEGEGSLFWFTCRLGKQREVEEDLHLPMQLHGKHLLVADDNVSCRETLARQLEFWGAKVSRAGSGEEMAAVLQEIAARDQVLDYAFVELEMADTDGLALARMLRQGNRFPHLQMVLMLPFYRVDTHGGYQSQGFAACLKKPIRYCDLLDTVSFLVSGRPLVKENKAATSQSLFHPLHGRQDEKILLAEDNLINQQVVAGIMKKLGYHHLDIVGNGREALAALRTARYSLVLMDIQMPELDGIQAVAKIRSGEAEVLDAHIPIIALTAHAMKGDKEKYLASGMNDYISKPIDPALLAVSLEQLLTPSPNGPVAQEVSTGEVPDDGEKDLPLVDFHGFVTRLFDDEELAAKIYSMFLQELPEHMARLAESVAAKDFSAIENIAHKLKGATGNVCAHRLNGLMRQLEMAAKQEHMEEVQRLLASASQVQILLLEMGDLPISSGYQN
jgi:CheY-like chemotaxis protein/HPt (histidine-containing phosphotransfer) domain-containing protein